MSNSSGYKLIKIITPLLSSVRIASGIHDRTDKDVTVSNLLLFISALIPKALASLMTSILLELAKPENVSRPP